MDEKKPTKKKAPSKSKAKAKDPPTAIPAQVDIQPPSTSFPTETDDGKMAEKNAGEEIEATSAPPPTAFPTETKEQRTEGRMAELSDQNEQDTQSGTTAGQIETGNDRILPAGPESVLLDNPATIALSSRAERLPGESRNACWERLRKMARAAGMPRGQGPGTAYHWADEQIARIFAKPIEPEPIGEEPAEVVLPTVGTTESAAADPEEPTIAVVPAPKVDDQGVSGLSNLPEGWPDLPANAQLQVEIAWVTANRLRVRDGTGVNLSKALSPAPSYSALSWLETSILFPAKFADISVKATAQSDDEREHIRREKMAIEEIRSILGEMLDSKPES